VDFDDFKRRWDDLEVQLQASQPPPRQDLLDVGELLSRGIGRLWREATDIKAQRQLAQLLFGAIYVDGEEPGRPGLRRPVVWRREARELLATALQRFAPGVEG